MHANEVEIDAEVVRRLVATQLPRWARLPVERVEPSGTDNALYRLGSDLVVRLPRTGRTAGTLLVEREWLPRLAPRLPLPIPLPVAEGAPAEGYPFAWSVYRWLDGEPATGARGVDALAVAEDLAGFVAALQAIDPSGGPAPGPHNAFRGIPLAIRDEATRASITALEHAIDVRAATEVWDEALGARRWTGMPVWIHGDLDARNVLVRDGRLSAVLDFGCLGVGDPACDVAAAWKLVPATARAAFRSALHVDDATWSRARGWVLSQAVNALSYYTPETNPTLVREAERWLASMVVRLRRQPRSGPDRR